MLRSLSVKCQRCVCISGVHWHPAANQNQIFPQTMVWRKIYSTSHLEAFIKWVSEQKKKQKKKKTFVLTDTMFSIYVHLVTDCTATVFSIVNPPCHPQIKCKITLKNKYWCEVGFSPCSLFLMMQPKRGKHDSIGMWLFRPPLLHNPSQTHFQYLWVFITHTLTGLDLSVFVWLGGVSGRDN